MKRKVRTEGVLQSNSKLDFKREVVKDILYQIDYQAALRRKVIDIPEKNMIDQLMMLPTNVLLSWYNAYLYFRQETMFSGYEMNGLKVLDQPYDAIRKKMENDPDFDLHKYIL
ncbi:MAG: hypothetical protein ACOY90_08205 [Candidatus Zhuqueibacterota bacterium]